MASLKAEKPVEIQPLAQVTRVPAGTKAAEGSSTKSPAASKPAPKRAARPKGKGKPGKSAGKQ